MKFFFIFIAVVLYSLHGKAQQNNILKNNPMEDFKRKELLTQKLKQMQSETNNHISPVIPEKVQTNNSVVKIPLTSTYAGNNGKGADIYNMQPYNMPCLVPDKTFSSNMPVAENEKAVKGFVSPFKKFEKEMDKRK